jgi:uncharacterized protein YbjT (DUF2867 family)
MSRIVVIGGTGLIGSKVVQKLISHGHDAVAASPNSGVDTITGEGLHEALEGASTVLDVSNSPSFADDDVMTFFTTATTNIIEAATKAGVGHYVILSVVGSDRMTESGYMRAKVAQEKLLAASGIPYSIVHATQFFEFVGGSPPLRPSATRFAFRTRRSVRWRLRTSRPPWRRPPRRSRSTPSSRSQDPSSSASTT